MAIKMIDGIKMKNGMDQVITTKGAVTEDGKFVVAACGRYVKNAQWVPSKRNKETEFRIPMRLDISISFMDGEKQGEYLFPYVSGRVLHLRGTFGSRLTAVTPFDNESRNQYKNAIIDQKIFNAMKAAIKFATKDASERVKNGEEMVTASDSDFIECAEDFLEAADMVISAAPNADKKESTTEGTVSDADDVAGQVLGIEENE